MKKKIVILPGDGIGKEVTTEGKRVLEKIASLYGHEFEFDNAEIGHDAIEATGNPLPDETLAKLKNCDAILFGAVGHPKYDNDPTAKVRPEQGLLKMRSNLGLYANIRPVKSYDALLDASPLKNDRIKGVDFIVVRELISGIYFGKPRGRSEDQTIAYDTCVYTKDEILKITEKAFLFARNRKKRVTLLDKANVLATSRLWRETVTEYAKQFPDIELECNYIDSAAMEVITKPSKFDVILTENLFGDIISDEASVIAGSLGVLPSASVGERIALYEPIHGSYPQAAGKNIANPMATILSAAMLLEYSFELLHEGSAIVDAVEKAMNEGFVTEDINNGKYTTSEVGDKIVEFILNPL